MWQTNPIFFSKRISLGVATTHYYNTLQARLFKAEDSMITRMDDMGKTVQIMEWSITDMQKRVDVLK